MSMMSELEKRMEEERQALRQEATAMAASAAAAGADRARTALSARCTTLSHLFFVDEKEPRSLCLTSKSGLLAVVHAVLKHVVGSRQGTHQHSIFDIS